MSKLIQITDPDAEMPEIGETESFYVGLATYTRDATKDANGNLITGPVYIPLRTHYTNEMGHLLVVGPPGCGKTNLILENLKFWKYSAVAIDTKGRTYEETAEIRKRFGGKVYVLDAKNGTGHRYNPVAAIPKELRLQLANELVGDSSSDSFWKSTAVAFWLTAWAAADHARQPHIPYAMQIIAQGSSNAYDYLIRHHKNDPETMRLTRAFYDMRDEKRADMDVGSLNRNKWASVTASAQPLYDVNVLNLFSGHDIIIENLFYEKATIYIQADETNEALFDIFSRLVTKTIGNALIREGDKSSKKRNPVFVFYDEFHKAPLKDVLGWLDTMRSRDVILSIFLQNLDQLSFKDKPYNFDKENSFSHFIFFKPNRPGGEISRYIAEMGYQTRGKSYGLPVGNEKGKLSDIEMRQIDDWQKYNALAVINAEKTEKYVVDPRPDVIGLSASQPAAPLPPVATYRSSDGETISDILARIDANEQQKADQDDQQEAQTSNARSGLPKLDIDAVF